MPEIVNSGNLCPICLFVAECQFKEKSGGFVTQCDNFRLDIPAFEKTKPICVDKINSADGNLPENGSANGRSMGLCHFCTKSDTCQLPKPEGGIWHCGDFSQ